MTRLALAALLASTATAAAAVPISTLGAGNTIVTVDSAAPATVLSTRTLSGIGAGQTLVGIDTRPVSPRVVYGLSDTGQLYAINGGTGVATAIGAPSPAPVGQVAFDFNPAVDRIRVFTTSGQNYRLNPDTGAVAGVDATPAFAPGDVNAGPTTTLTAAAYTNNIPAAPSTTLYAIDSVGRLLRVGSLAGTPPVVSPNTGQLNTVGGLGLTTGVTTNTGFDISASGQVLATLSNLQTGTTSLYSVNLTTGLATLIGQVGPAGANFNGLAFTQASFASFGLTPNQIAVGAALDSFVGVPSAGLNAVFNSLDALAPGDRGAALAQFTPASLSLLPDLTLRTAEFQEQTIRRYLRDFRAGGTGVDGTAGLAAPGDRKFGSFIVGTASDGRYDATGDRTKLSFGTTGVMAGLDLRFGEKSLIGVTGGYHNTDANLGASPRSRIESYFGGGYGTLGVGPIYVDVFGTYGEADYDLRRAVRFGTGPTGTGFGTDLTFQSQTDSRTYLAGGTIGLSFNFAGFEVEPFAGVRYANLRIDGFDEGTGVGAISLGRNKYESVLSNAGLRIGGAFEVGNVTVRPEIRGAYRHEFQKDSERSFTFGFGGPGSGPVTFIPTALSRDYYTGGAGFTVSGPTSPLSLVVDYNGEFDKDRRINSITGGLRLTF